MPESAYRAETIEDGCIYWENDMKVVLKGEKIVSGNRHILTQVLNIAAFEGLICTFSFTTEQFTIYASESEGYWHWDPEVRMHHFAFDAPLGFLLGYRHCNHESIRDFFSIFVLSLKLPYFSKRYIRQSLATRIILQTAFEQPNTPPKVGTSKRWTPRKSGFIVKS